jgi:release factor glutamine methyltransferase
MFNKTNPLSIQDCLLQAQKILSDSQSPNLDAQLLLAKTLNCDKIKLYQILKQNIDTHSLQIYSDLIKRRMQHEPIAYILGFQEFMSLEFNVNSSVLIPRADSELLVEESLAWIKNQQIKNPHLLDIGTGSGCLCLSLLKLNKNISAQAWDISTDAIEIAKSNQKKLLIKDERIKFKIKDALAPNSYCKKTDKKFDLIISNPPYIGEREKKDLSKDVINYEPHSALFADKNGLLFYETLAQHAGKILMHNAAIFVELSTTISCEIIEIFKSYKWQNLKTFEDISKKPRVLRAIRPKDY